MAQQTIIQNGLVAAMTRRRHPSRPPPAADVGSVAALMDLAVSMEREAALRYRQLADEMRRVHDREMAALFDDLAALEARHEDELGRWARREGLASSQPREFSWELPETFGRADSGPLTPYRALCTAVRNEERAFAFYVYMAADAATPAVRARAEALAREELEHLAQLRRLRRRAYHAQRATRPPARPAPADRDQLRMLAHGLEAGSAEIDALAEQALRRAGRGAAAQAVASVVAEDRRRAAALAGPGAPGCASDVLEAARGGGLETGTAETSLGLALRNAEEVLEAYLSVADSAADEALLAEAQRLSEHAVARLAVIRSQIAEVED